MKGYTIKSFIEFNRIKNKIDGYYEAKLMYHPDVTKLKVEGIRGTGKASIELAED